MKNSTRYSPPKSSKKPFARVLLAHGAGAGRTHAWMVACAKGLAARGLETITFDFAYVTAGRKAPDKAAKLEARWLEVVQRLGKPDLPLVLAGKSMGGRIASHVVARGAVQPIGLVFFGYPLHPPKHPEKRRDAHLPAVGEVPMLFVQGSRDDFGDEAEMKALVKTLPTATLRLVPGGRHSFDLDAGIFDDVAEFVQRLVVAATTTARSR